MRLNKNARGYMITCNQQGCNRLTWWLPQRSITSAVAKAEHACPRCFQRRGILVKKLALVIDIRVAPRGLPSEALVCPCCDDIWEEWDQNCLPLPPTNRQKAIVAPTSTLTVASLQVDQTYSRSNMATSDYAGALTGSNAVTKGKKSTSKSVTVTRTAAISSVVTDSDAPSCSCGVAAKRLTVSKEGPNKGRPFYGCSS